MKSAGAAIDLLYAQNQYFDASVSLMRRAAGVFAEGYQAPA